MNTNGRMILTGKAEVTGEEPAPVPLYPPQIPHGLPWDKRGPSGSEAQD